jgi:predicted O-methyltransferase YrrM
MTLPYASLDRMRRSLRRRFSRRTGSPWNRLNRIQPEANKWALSEFILRSLAPVVGVQTYPLDELLMMCSTVGYFRPGIVVEWGTNIGLSARIFYEAAKYLHLETQIHSIDLPVGVEHIENAHRRQMRGAYVRGLDVTLHEGDGLDVCLTILSQNRGLFPLIFVDGDHAEASVRRELDGLYAGVPQAAVLAHDTFVQGPEAGYNHGPWLAVDAFAEEHGLKVTSTVLGLPGMSLLYWSRGG